MVVADVLRATSSIVYAIERGAAGIKPVSTTEQALAFKEMGYLVGAEREARKCSFAHFGNDPEEYTPQTVRGKEIVLTTSNGTPAFEVARQYGARFILAGSFVNLTAVARFCREHHPCPVTVIACGWKGRFCSEDTLLGGALCYTLQQMGVQYAYDDLTRLCTELYALHQTDLTEYLSTCDHQQRLLAAGYPRALALCTRRDACSALPLLQPAPAPLEYILRNYPLR